MILQLPDYHEVVAHPMDFSTVRKKLANGAYANLEQFEVGACLVSGLIYLLGVSVP